MKALYKWFAYKLPIRSKLLISFSILVMVPILVLGIYSYQQSKENTERQIRSTMESNLTRLRTGYPLPAGSLHGAVSCLQPDISQRAGK